MSLREEDSHIHGMLLHKSKVLRKWKPRYYWLIDITLYVSNTPNLAEFKSKIAITEDTLIIFKDKGKEPYFFLKNKIYSKYQLKTTLKEMMNWVYALRSASHSKDPRGINYSLEQFRILKELGKGAYGKVFLVEKLDTFEKFALKVLKKKLLAQIDQIETVIRERNILGTIPPHPFIVGLSFSFQTPTKFYLGLEYASGGELLKYFRKFQHFPIDETRLYVAELVLALNHLHENGVIFRDLKPENVLLDATGHVKLTDFGLSKFMEGKVLHTFAGTLEYASPEMVADRGYDFSTDYWSLGILLYEMIFQTTPFYDENEKRLCQNILTKEPKYPRYGHKTAHELIQQLLKKEATERIRYPEIMNHSFFRGLNWDNVVNKKIKPASFVEQDLTEPMNFQSLVEGIDSNTVGMSKEIDISGFTFGGSMIPFQGINSTIDRSSGN